MSMCRALLICGTDNVFLGRKLPRVLGIVRKSHDVALLIPMTVGQEALDITDVVDTAYNPSQRCRSR
jgi:hypothetical protein